MKPVLAIFAFAAALATPALAEPPAPAPILGSWAVDVTKLPMPPKRGRRA